MEIKLTGDQESQLITTVSRLYNNARDFMETYQLGTIGQNYEYYHGMLPIRQREAISDYTDRTCYESVSGCLQDMQNIFMNGGDAVEFQPVDSQDAYAAKAATKLVNQILLRDNDGYSLLSSAIHDALIVRNAFIKRYWDVELITQTEHAEGLKDENEVQAYLMGLKAGGLDFGDDNEENISMEQQPDGTFNVTITYTAPIKRVKVEHVPIEEIVIDVQAKNLHDAVYMCHRVKRNKSQLKDLGLTEDELNEISTDERFASYWAVSILRNHGRQDMYQEDNGMYTEDLGFSVWVKEHYVKTSSISEDGSLRLYKVIETCNKILHIEEVNEMPFSVITPLPIPNAIFGESLVDITKDIQNLKTWIKRSIIDNAQIAAYGRYAALTGAYDRRSLLDSRPGGVVEMDRPDAVTMLPTAQLPQGLDFLMNTADAEKEMRTGVSRTSQGVNADMLKGDHGFDAINALQTAAQGKMKMIARNIAHGGLTDLMRSIYRLFRENATTPVNVMTAQGLIAIHPAQLPPREHIKVSVALSPQEKNDKVARIQQFIATIPMIEQASSEFIQPQHKHFLYSELLSTLGYENTNDFIIPIEQYQPQPDVMGQLTMQQLQAQIQYVSAQANKLVNDAHLDTERLGFEQQKAADETQHNDSRLAFEQQKAADDTLIKHRELDIKQGTGAAKAQHNGAAQPVKEYEAETKRLKALADAQKNNHVGASAAS